MQKPTIEVGTELPGCVVVAIKTDHILVRRDNGEVTPCDFDAAERLVSLKDN